MRRVFPVLVSAALLASLAACPGGLPDKPTVPDGPDTSGVPDAPDSGGSAVDANRCGNYASTNIGAKIKTFLKATVALDKAVSDAENHVKLACVDMGKELSMGDAALKGGMRPLVYDGRLKVLSGTTTPDEIARVAQVAEEEE